MNLILASTSPYRANLLARLQVPFTQMDPDWAEQSVAGERPIAMCERLARGKAAAAAGRATAAPWLIIGSDQVCHLDGEIFGKPGHFDRAAAQLRACSGRWVTFDTGLAVLSSDGKETVTSERYEVHFRSLDDTAIEGYLTREQPYDCAGSLKAEALGITLLDDSRGRDITTLLGLPLMCLQDVLADMGFDLLNDVKLRDQFAEK